MSIYIVAAWSAIFNVFHRFIYSPFSVQYSLFVLTCRNTSFHPSWEPRWSSGYTSRLSSGRPGFDARSWLPAHIIHIFIVYIHLFHHRPTDGDVKWRSRVLRAHKRTRVAVVEFHVSLYPISVSPFFPLCMLNVWI